MKAVFLSRFYKDLDNINDQSVKNKIIKIIDNVENADFIMKISGIKKLKGYSNAYRIRNGDYRIGIFVENDIVEFARVIHRKDIYKLFP